MSNENMPPDIKLFINNLNMAICEKNLQLVKEHESLSIRDDRNIFNEVILASRMETLTDISKCLCDMVGLFK